MPSAQPPGLPAETGRGPGIPGFYFLTDPFSNAVEAGWKTTSKLFALVGSAIRLGGPGDMPKPSDLGAPQPTNTLSINGTPARDSYSFPPPRRTTPSQRTPTKRPLLERISSSPPAKRQKHNELDLSPVHSQITFALDHTIKTLKRPAEINLISETSESSNGIREFHLLDRFTKTKRTRTRRNQLSVHTHNVDIPIERAWLACPKPPDEVSEEEEVDFIEPPVTHEVSGLPEAKGPEERPISEIPRNFKSKTSARLSPSRCFSDVVDCVDKRIQHQEPDLSADELAMSPDDIDAPRPVKRRKPHQPNLSKKHNIPPTRFHGPYTTGQLVIDTDDQQINEPKVVDLANSIIGPGLRILRVVCGQSRYEMNDESPDRCLLSLGETGHTLLLADSGNKPLEAYKSLAIHIDNAKTVLHNAESCIVSIDYDRADVGIGGGPKLMVEFVCRSDLIKFMQWVKIHTKDDKPTVKRAPKTKLESEFEIMLRRNRNLTAGTLGRGPIGDDIKLIQHNQNSRVTGLCPATEPGIRTRLRDAMNSLSRPKPQDGVMIIDRQQNGQQTATQRQERRTRPKGTRVDSPESPEPESWTSLNPTWAKQWRNSLVYPATGKSRAIVDKEDIQRLDEGQFLNDNLVIFYLRYLQQKLEDDEPELAKRVYFHNTFFYDKLKPTRTGQGINYDSVKAWTSKVDLFSKDFIIVPINEYTHWYVAIIYNAPKLVPRSETEEQIDGAESDVITIPDIVDTPQEIPASPKNDASHRNLNGEDVTTSGQENVTESLRCMSIDSTNQLDGEAKLELDNNAADGVDLTISENGQEVPLVTDTDRPEPEVEHIITVTGTQSHRRSGKKQNTGCRKPDLDQTRIITLDSLGVSHSPTCNYLRQYLTAELRDKKRIEPAVLSIKGTAAKDVPEQTNHCDCGLFLLGYIKQFLVGPDNFIKSVLQRDGRIPWNVNPSELRNNIRNLIFDLQKQQQKAEDLARERKMQARKTKLGAKPENSNPVIPRAPDLACGPSNQDCASGKQSESRSLPVSPISRPADNYRVDGAIGREAVDSDHSPDPRSESKSCGLITENDDAETENDVETSDNSETEEARVGPKAKMDPLVVTSPPKPEQSGQHVIGAFPDTPVLGRTPLRSPISPVPSRIVRRSSPSSETEVSVDIQQSFLSPLVSETPSSKGSGGATPVDPVVLDGPEDNGGDCEYQSDLKCIKSQPAPGRHLVIAIPSKRSRLKSRGHDAATQARKRTGEQSPYFPIDRDGGERVTAAKLRETTQSDVIDLSED